MKRILSARTLARDIHTPSHTHALIHVLTTTHPEKPHCVIINQASPFAYKHTHAHTHTHTASVKTCQCVSSGIVLVNLLVLFLEYFHVPLMDLGTTERDGGQIVRWDLR